MRIDCPDLCLRYTARVVRGVKIGPSPKWLTRRLETVGMTPINNVVDISNYVMMECGQPLHTFDFGKLEGGEIIVRRPLPGETIEAIDHKTYALAPGDVHDLPTPSDPVAIGGVMGGAQTEISAATRDVLVEAAEFDPVSIRNTARQLNLHSDSSYRFERRVDPEGIDWASRRCCELILGTGRRRIGRRRGRRGPAAAAARADRAAVLAIEADPGHRRAGRAGAGDSAWRWATSKRSRSRVQRFRAAKSVSRKSQVRKPHVPHRRSAQLAARPDARDRPDRRSGADPRLRGDSRGRGRADGPLGPAARGPRAGEGPPRADRRRLRRGDDLERGRRADLGRR